MTQETDALQWEEGAQKKYQAMIDRIPLFHRQIAKEVVDKRAAQNALDRQSAMIEEADIVRAFFSEVPKAFYSLMIRLFDEVGFHYSEHDTQG